VFADPIVIGLRVLGTATDGVLVTNDPIVIGVGLGYPTVLTEPVKHNLVAWTQVGYADFTKGQDNVAGDGFMDWHGWVWDIRKLNNKPVAYGENGVTILLPFEKTFGLQTIHRVGIESKQAVTGTDFTHWFVDNKGYLYELGEELKKLDYSEYLSAMSGIVMSYDKENELVYICDGTYGYVYSPKDKSLGSGPVNVTGIGSKAGTQYIVSPAAITTIVPEFCTNIYDFGSRNGKSIHSHQISTDVTGTLSTRISYRYDKGGAFQVTGWHVVDSRGQAHIPCFGYEFMFWYKLGAYEYFEIDELMVDVTIHDH
jgi:hypothetical protein